MTAREKGKLRNVAPPQEKAWYSFSKLSTFTPKLISVDRKLEEKYFQMFLGPKARKQMDCFIPKELKTLSDELSLQNIKQATILSSVHLYSSSTMLIFFSLSRKEKTTRLDIHRVLVQEEGS